MSSTGQLRKLGPALCLIAGLAAFGSGFAQDASPLEISTSAFQEIERTAEDGTTSIERVAASKVVPGGEVVYEISYQNRGSASATDVVINNPVPEGLEYTSSDKTPVAAVSVDGGNTFGDIADLDAIRSSLGAPVQGLAFAFGTSIAGVASSAMLGLLSALCRRERLQTVQLLDVQIATTLRPHSRAWQREEAFRLLQQQTALMPALVDRLDAMTSYLREHPDASLLSGLSSMPIPLEAIRANLKMTIGGGLNEPRDVLTTTAWALMTHRDQLDACVENPRLWAAAFEGLRDRVLLRIHQVQVEITQTTRFTTD